MSEQTNNQQKILLIEDEEMLLEMYTLKFSKAGFKVFQTKDGKSGLELAKEEKPALVLLDIIIPKLDGFTILKELKQDEATKKIPVILFSNLGQEENVKKSLILGATDYFVKADYTPTQIVEKVKKILSQR